MEKTSKDFEWVLQLSGEKTCKVGSQALSGGKDTSETILRV